MVACKEKYLPSIIKLSTGYLVVEGVIVANNDSTIIKLSRTSNISDTLLPHPEAGAKVSVAGETNDRYDLTDAGNGNYVSPGLNLDFSKKYQLVINTADGKEYRSDLVPIKQTPAIDSVAWYQDSSNDVQVNVTTHDPANSTIYYRWDYTETWQYRSSFESNFDWINHGAVARQDGDRIYYCWASDNSSNILTGTSLKLAKDVIYKAPITTVKQTSEKIGLFYSILVKQYALTKEAFEFWQNLKLTTEQLGTLFDPQPTQVVSNIHCITNPSEIVVGYVSASTVQSKRIFINNLDLYNWGYQYYFNKFNCNGRTITPDSMDFYFLYAQPRLWVLWGTLPPSHDFIVFPTICSDCRLHGGTNVKPPYWP